MDCNQCKKSIRLMLLEEREVTYSPEFREHLDDCPECSKFLLTELEIERILYESSPADVRAKLDQLVQTLIDIGSYRNRSGGVFTLTRGMKSFVAVGVLAWGGSLFAPSAAGALVGMLLILGSTTIIYLRHRQPFFTF